MVARDESGGRANVMGKTTSNWWETCKVAVTAVVVSPKGVRVRVMGIVVVKGTSESKTLVIVPSWLIPPGVSTRLIRWVS